MTPFCEQGILSMTPFCALPTRRPVLDPLLVYYVTMEA